MNGGSIEQELARIDAAISRVESSARAKSAPADTGDLSQRHDDLRQAVTRTIAEIDAMIASDGE